MHKPIILIKIGGSLITDKNKPFTVNEEALDIIASEVKKAVNMGKLLIIGHGAGSFAHVPAKKYQTHKGIINKQSYRGIAEVSDVAARLNRIVIKKFLKEKINAVSVSPLSSMVASEHKLSDIFTKSIELLLTQGLLPVVYGDQILDEKMGCTIFSTEKVLAYLGLALKAKDYRVEQIIQCGQTSGVYDADGKTIKEINGKNIGQYRQNLGGSGGTDVTGGMLHKVEETLLLAKQGIPGLIIDGIVHGTLSDAIGGKSVKGTKITA
jgi:isopentenyl phosphate kinase